MASIAKIFYLIFFLTLLSSLQIHARDGQFFNKVPSNNGEKETQTVIPNKEQEPNFMPENENGAYGLYGHDSVSTTTNKPNVNNLPNSKYLPKNYNPVSYVTVLEDNTNENNFNNNNNNEFTTKHTTVTTSNDNQFYSGPANYRSNNNNNNQQQYYHAVNDYNTKYNNNNNHQQQSYSDNNLYNNNQQYYNIDNNNNDEEQYYNGANTYYYNNNHKDQQQGLTETRLSARSYSTNPTNIGNNYNNNNNQEQSYSTNYNSYNTGNGNYRVRQQQGMSDTRFLGNGKFFYDINAEKHARDPYENGREFAAMNRQYNNRNTYGNNEYKNNNSFENEEEFHDEENMP